MSEHFDVLMALIKEEDGDHFDAVEMAMARDMLSRTLTDPKFRDNPRAFVEKARED